jgi:glycosyltransferase involved in cell wall biosynthesis
MQDLVQLHWIGTSTGNIPYYKRGALKVMNVVNAIENIIAFNKKFSECDPDIVHIGTSYSTSFAKHAIILLLAKIRGSKVVLHPRFSYEKLWAKNHLLNILIRLILSMSDGIIVLSEEWLNDGLKEYRHKMVYILNAINLEPYLSIAEKKRDSFEPINILYIGHVGAEKGVFDLIRAIDELQKNGTIKVNVNIVGEELKNGEGKRARHLIGELGLNDFIHIYPPEYGEKKYRRFECADILVLPSYHEGMPISIIEAMAAGLPIIATNIGGIPDLVKNNLTGILITPGDIAQLANAVDRLAHSSELRKMFGEEARRSAIANHDINQIAEQIVSFYHKILS